MSQSRCETQMNRGCEKVLDKPILLQLTIIASALPCCTLPEDSDVCNHYEHTGQGGGAF